VTYHLKGSLSVKGPKFSKNPAWYYFSDICFQISSSDFIQNGHKVMARTENATLNFIINSI